MFRLIILHLILGLSPLALASEVKHFNRPCHSIESDSLSTDLLISSTSWTITHTAYEEDNCATPYLIYETAYSFSKVENDLDLTVIESSYTVVTDEVARALNLIGYCDITDWEPKVKRIVSGKTCDEFNAPAVGDKLYTIQRTEIKDGSEKLYIGIATEKNSGKTSSERHNTLDKLHFNFIQVIP